MEEEKINQNMGKIKCTQFIEKIKPVKYMFE